ncbi:DUF4947 domain-containing protein [Enterococcus raffinosus]|uniref:DUF4947 domain-containing protein n=1 Tax=Enterococcus raffinosus TaxID=71452 RepID=UPI00254D38C5|nr:DUF4947 domain-containing protein [Enterococcus raffinosus]MDK7991093.1 DUF4947 domain-containing protein [Enterococcus raffinosus]
MKGLVCNYCGGNHFNKTAEGYECDYCHAVYEFEEKPKKMSSLPQKRMPITRITLLIMLGLLLVSGFFLVITKEQTPTKTASYPNPAAIDKPGKETYTASQLKNPERNVRIAELSLNQAELKLASASVKEYGGDKTADFEERLKKAQAEHESLKNKRLKTAPKEDMIIENPDSEFAVTTYYREAGFLAAYGPNFDQYSSSDIIRIWGQPDDILTNSEKIQKNLTLEFDDQNNPVSYEAKVLREQWQQGKLTWREVRAFIAFVQDNSYAGYTKQFVYEKQGKPNVYFTDNQVGYVTPIVRYVSFTRLPEKYPRAGLGKYPDDFPENYGSDGLYHEK